LEKEGELLLIKMEITAMRSAKIRRKEKIFFIKPSIQYSKSTIFVANCMPKENEYSYSSNQDRIEKIADARSVK